MHYQIIYYYNDYMHNISLSLHEIFSINLWNSTHKRCDLVYRSASGTTDKVPHFLTIQS